MEGSSYIKEQIEALNLPFSGEIAFDRELEDSVGDINKLSRTNLAQNLKQIVLNMPEFRL